MTGNIEEISTKFECVKLGMRHSKDGHVISFAIHPNDTPQDLMTDPLGQRYMIVAVRINEHDEPVASVLDAEGKRSVALAGTLCADNNFQEWLVRVGEVDEMSEVAASTWLRKYLGVTSRKELKTDSRAREKLSGLRSEFVSQLNHGILR